MDVLKRRNKFIVIKPEQLSPSRPNNRKITICFVTQSSWFLLCAAKCTATRQHDQIFYFLDAFSRRKWQAKEKINFKATISLRPHALMQQLTHASCSFPHDFLWPTKWQVRDSRSHNVGLRRFLAHRKFVVRAIHLTCTPCVAAQKEKKNGGQKEKSRVCQTSCTYIKFNAKESRTKGTAIFCCCPPPFFLSSFIRSPLYSQFSALILTPSASGWHSFDSFDGVWMGNSQKTYYLLASRIAGVCNIQRAANANTRTKNKKNKRDENTAYVLFVLCSVWMHWIQVVHIKYNNNE